MARPSYTLGPPVFGGKIPQFKLLSMQIITPSEFACVRGHTHARVRAHTHTQHGLGSLKKAGLPPTWLVKQLSLHRVFGCMRDIIIEHGNNTSSVHSVLFQQLVGMRDISLVTATQQKEVRSVSHPFQDGKLER
jgi:hypothetical protein